MLTVDSRLPYRSEVSQPRKIRGDFNACQTIQRPSNPAEDSIGSAVEPAEQKAYDGTVRG
jgi:hypothetical protein